MDYNHSIYMICDPRKSGMFWYCDDNDEPKLSLFEEPFYVGQTNNFELRKRGHLNESRNYFNINLLKEQRIRDILMDGMEPLFIIIKENLYLDESNELEKYYISLIKRIHEGGSLLNVSIGGNASTGYIHTLSARKIISLNSLKNWDNPLFRTKIQGTWEGERREKLSQRSKNNWSDSHFREKVKIKRWTEENRNKQKQISEKFLLDPFIRKENSERMKNDNPMKRNEVKEKSKLSWTEERREIQSGRMRDLVNSQDPEYVYTFINSNGQQFIVLKLKSFCESNNIKYKSIITNFWASKQSNIIKYKKWIIKREKYGLASGNI